MKAFEFVAAKDAEHAIALLAARGPSAKVMAGGTDLLVELKFAADGPGLIVDLSRAADLKGIAMMEEGLRIGATVTHAEIAKSPVVRALTPVLGEAARSIGAVQTRNLGTIGGNLMNCVPSMDIGPALLALDASVTVGSPRGRRRMPLAELFVGPRATSLRHDELLLDIVVPARNLRKPTAFLKFGLRKGQALALVNVAAGFWLAADGTCREPCIALGAVAPTVMRARQAEAYLAGAAATPDALAEAGRRAAAEARPISDLRASADYRRHLVAVLTARALAASRAQQEQRS